MMSPNWGSHQMVGSFLVDFCQCFTVLELKMAVQNLTACENML